MKYGETGKNLIDFENISVCTVSLGCPKNLVDSELMLGMPADAGFKLCTEPDEADVIIVNTCGFIDSAKEEAINTILEMAQYKKERCKALIVAGCLAQRYNKEILKEMPEVDFVLGTGSYGDIIFAVKSALQKGDCSIMCANLSGVGYLNGKRVISTPNSYAYLKIAEGCDNKCTYCVIPRLRGAYRSRSKEDILKEAETLAKNGYKEIILVAQDTTRYGTDIYGKPVLADLIEDICKIDAGDFQLRILYCYPDEITDELIHVMANNPKVCKYMDIPVQHGSDRILLAMGRRSLSGEIKEKIFRLRKEIPEIYIRTSIIVGFPGETEEDFEILCDFVKEVRFDRLGVFTYSKEEGTKAAAMEGQIPQRIKNSRMNKLMKIQQKISKEINEKRVGKVYDVIVENISDDNIFYTGRTFAEAPEIDGTVYFTAHGELNAGDKIKVKILNIEEYDLIGEQWDEFTE